VFSLHDRKLCVLGLCTLLNSSTARPVAVNECAAQIIPSMILLFDGLKRAYVGQLCSYVCKRVLWYLDSSDVATSGHMYFIYICTGWVRSHCTPVWQDTELQILNIQGMPGAPDGFCNILRQSGKLWLMYFMCMRICVNHYCLNVTGCRWLPCHSAHTCGHDGAIVVTHYH